MAIKGLEQCFVLNEDDHLHPSLEQGHQRVKTDFSSKENEHLHTKCKTKPSEGQSYDPILLKNHH